MLNEVHQCPCILSREDEDCNEGLVRSCMHESVETLLEAYRRARRRHFRADEEMGLVSMHSTVCLGHWYNAMVRGQSLHPTLPSMCTTVQLRMRRREIGGTSVDVDMDLDFSGEIVFAFEFSFEVTTIGLARTASSYSILSHP